MRKDARYCDQSCVSMASRALRGLEKRAEDPPASRAAVARSRGDRLGPSRRDQASRIDVALPIEGARTDADGGRPTGLRVREDPRESSGRS